MSQNKPIILLDPYPRTMELIFSKENLQYLKKNYKLISAPNKNKNNFYEKNLPKADYIFGQQNLKQYLMWKAILWTIWITIIVLEKEYMF